MRIPSPVASGPPANIKVVPVFTSPLHGAPGQAPIAVGSVVNRILVSVALTTPDDPIPKVPIGEANAYPPSVKTPSTSFAITLFLRLYWSPPQSAATLPLESGLHTLLCLSGLERNTVGAFQ